MMNYFRFATNFTRFLLLSFMLCDALDPVKYNTGRKSETLVDNSNITGLLVVSVVCIFDILYKRRKMKFKSHIHTWIKKVKGRHLYTATYREALTSSGLQFEVAYWLATHWPTAEGWKAELAWAPWLSVTRDLWLWDLITTPSSHS